jgi:hypothetical protein
MEKTKVHTWPSTYHLPGTVGLKNIPLQLILNFGYQSMETINHRIYL